MSFPKGAFPKGAFPEGAFPRYFDRINLNLSKSLTEDIPQKEILQKLRTSWKSGKLVLALGAGVSKNYGLPDWNTLLQELYLESLEYSDISKEETQYKARDVAKYISLIFSPNPLIVARNVRQHYKKNNDELYFEEIVRKSIYKKIDSTITDKLFEEIRELCNITEKSHNLDSIITYNFDDVLETHLSSFNTKNAFKSIYNVGIRAKVDELPIYHVHGFLPRKGKLSSENKITLSEDIYHQQYTNIYNWSNLTQLSKFIENPCLFIGTSLKDPNLRRLLDIAKIQRGKETNFHYIIRKRYDVNEIMRIHSPVIDELIKISDNEITDYYDYQNEQKIICKDLKVFIEKFEVEDALSFGVNTIWVNDYDDIHRILNEIRTL